MNDELDGFEPVARIIVIGVGGAGNNAVNRMIDEKINNVEFYVANTDKQALSLSKAPNRLILGEDITNGLGAGGDPKVGKEAAEASKDDIKNIVAGANLVFIAAGMGGGTGTGAAPVIGQIAKESGALTVAIVTRPFAFEGNKRTKFSVEGLNELKKNVDSLIVVSNDKLLMNSGNLPLGQAFSEADKVLALSVKTVTDLILMPAVINLDFADVKATLKESGVALIGYGTGSGDKRAEDAAFSALSSPLIEQSIKGATRGICHVTSGPKVSLYDAQACVQKIIEASGGQMDLKFGISINDQLEDTILVSIIASGFAQDIDFSVTEPINNSLFASKPKESSDTLKKSNNADGLVKNEEVKESDDDDIIPSFLEDK